MPTQIRILLNISQHKPGKVYEDVASIMSSVVMITDMIQTTFKLVKQTDKQVSTFTIYNQDINGITNCCIYNWSWTPAVPDQSRLTRSSCSQSNQCSQPESEKIISDVDVIPDRLKFDIIDQIMDGEFVLSVE